MGWIRAFSAPRRFLAGTVAVIALAILSGADAPPVSAGGPVRVLSFHLLS
jgi:hypothetical protein